MCGVGKNCEAGQQRAQEVGAPGQRRAGRAVHTCAASSKMSGSRKLSIAHSSCRLFCSGVPVISSRKCVENSRTFCARNGRRGEVEEAAVVVARTGRRGEVEVAAAVVAVAARRTWARTDCSFLMRCASSMTR